MEYCQEEQIISFSVLCTYLELVHSLVVFDADLAHVQHSIIKHPHEYHTVWPFLRALTDYKKTRVVLLRPKVEGRGILEWSDNIFLG